MKRNKIKRALAEQVRRAIADMHIMKSNRAAVIGNSGNVESPLYRYHVSLVPVG